MGGMIVQEITKISGNRVNKLICFATGSTEKFLEDLKQLMKPEKD